MSRIFWDSMLAIYLLEDHPQFAPRVLEILERSMKRNDLLFTSYVALGEILAGAAKSPKPEKTKQVKAIMDEIGFSYLPFDSGAVEPFALKTQA